MDEAKPNMVRTHPETREGKPTQTLCCKDQKQKLSPVTQYVTLHTTNGTSQKQL